MLGSKTQASRELPKNSVSIQFCFFLGGFSVGKQTCPMFREWMKSNFSHVHSSSMSSTSNVQFGGTLRFQMDQPKAAKTPLRVRFLTRETVSH